MGNCAGNPKTNEGDAPVPVPEEVKVEQPETKPEETPVEASDDKSLGTLLNEVFTYLLNFFFSLIIFHYIFFVTKSQINTMHTLFNKHTQV